MIDVLVIGGGIAGVSVAAALPAALDVMLVDREAQLGAHSTGRSAALFYPSYGHASSVRLAAASLDYFENGGFLSPRGVLTVAAKTHRGEVEAMLAGSVDPGAEIVDGLAALQQHCSALAGPLDVGLYEPAVHDIDVMAVHASMVREARARGVEVSPNSGVVEIRRDDGNRWRVETGAGTLAARVIVNASGAWGDEIAELAGVEPVGLTPKRRTAFTVSAPTEAETWPAVVDVAHSWYFKPEGPQLLCSPAEEQASPPGDPKPAMEDVAAAIERINRSTSLGIRSVTSEWTGLRTFVTDGAMVIGFDPAAPGFFWLVGQGGTGIQTAPAAGALAAAAIADVPLSGSLTNHDVVIGEYGIERLRS